MRRKVLFLIWLLAWLALVPVGVLSLPPARSAGTTLAGAAMFALPTSLAVLALVAIMLAAFRRRPDRGEPHAVVFALLVTVGVGSSMLNHPLTHAVRQAPVVAANFALSPEAAMAAQDRIQAERVAEVFGVVALMLTGLNAALYLCEPMRGPRRVAVVVGVVAAIATGAALVIAEQTDVGEVLIAFGTVSITAGLATTLLLLLMVASFRWVRAGFAADRSRDHRPSAEATGPTAEVGA